jgi:putative flippase GtrA
VKKLFQKYQEMISYLFFGAATTIVNMGVFFICTNLFSIDYKLSNAIGWFLSVLFAFFTNKYFVFSSKHESIGDFFKEMFLFYWYRVLSFVIDMGMMIVMIDYLHISDFWAKLITQVVVIVLNYFFSKFFIFKKKV